MPPNSKGPDMARLDRVVAQARREREQREQGYRERALKIHPWICARCTREFDRSNVHLLTVHHKDHNHDHNPPDGSNWELLCVYCHENEHARMLDAAAGGSASASTPGGAASHRPFEALNELLRGRK
jgi:5-methylcytosine-specific restriction endonuclease McrA